MQMEEEKQIRLNSDHILQSEIINEAEQLRAEEEQRNLEFVLRIQAEEIENARLTGQANQYMRMYQQYNLGQLEYVAQPQRHAQNPPDQLEASHNQ